MTVSELLMRADHAERLARVTGDEVRAVLLAYAVKMRAQAALLAAVRVISC